MAFKRIQLRGISRTPSDRMSEDGGLAESLNLQLDNTESSPSPLPLDVTADYGLPDTFVGDIIYLHKTPNYSNAIVSTETDEGTRVGVYDETETSGVKAFIVLNAGVEIKDITSIGNTIVLCSDNDMWFALYKDKEYHLLGNQVPFPSIELYNGPVTRNNGLYGEGTESLYVAENTTRASMIDAGQTVTADWQKFSKTVWNDWDAKTGENKNADVLRTIKVLWSAIDAIIDRNNDNSVFSHPIWAKYALKLYDGSYIDSDPFLIGAGGLPYATIKGYTSNTNEYRGLFASLHNTYQLFAKMFSPESGDVLQDWTDIVTEICFFISLDIDPATIDKSRNRAEVISVTEGTDANGKTYNAEIKLGQWDEKDIEDTYLSRSQYYLCKSISLTKHGEYNTDDMDTLKAGMQFDDINNHMSATDRVSNGVTLEASYLARHRLIAENIMSYNSRTIFSNVRQVLSSGPASLTGKRAIYDFGDNTKPEYIQLPNGAPRYKFKYYIKSESGETYTVISRDYNGTTNEIGPTYDTILGNQYAGRGYIPTFDWLSYPDPRCYRVDVYVSTGKCTWFPMYSHPYLPCAYYFFGPGKDLYSAVLERLAEVSAQWTDAEEKIEQIDGKIYQSEVSNPFVIPASGRITVGAGKILNIATTTKPISTGQFGQFPLYAFGTDGIYALSTNSDGSLSSSSPLSMEVVVSKEVVTPIDQAIVMVTARGVQILMGGDIQPISPDMLGQHYSLAEDSEVVTLLKSGKWASLANVIVDNTPFMRFMATARCSYDYNGSRLIFFNAGKDSQGMDYDYAYVYRLATKTWHKMSTPQGFRFIRTLNSYPDSEAVFEQLTAKSGVYPHKIFRFSTVLDVTSEQESPSCIITRPIDFDEPDVLKTINHLRIRGSYKRYECQLKFSTSLLEDNIEQILEATGYTHLFTSDDIAMLQRQGTLVKDVRKEDVDDLNAAIVEEGIENLQLIRTEQPRVAYMLLASQDGINYKRIGSLRGKSWKMFRIVILASLKPYERISWIDFEYESRFKNRLR